MNTYLILLIVASAITLAGYLWMVVTGFKRSLLWGVLVTLFYPISALVFAATNWFDARKPFVVYVLSLLLLVGSVWTIYNEVGTRNAQQIAERLQNGKLGLADAAGLVSKALNHVGPIDLFAEELQQAVAGQPVGQVAAAVQDSVSRAATAPEELAQATEAKPTAAAGSEREDKPAATPETPATPADAGADKTSEADAAAEQPAEQKPATPKYPTPGRVQPDPLVPKKKKEEPNTIVVSMNKLPNYIGHYFIFTLNKDHEQRGLLVKVNDTSLTVRRKLYGGNFEYKISKSQIKAIHMLTKIPEEK